MALPNGDLITTPFDPQMAYPSDRRMQVDTLNARDSISMFIRWEGMPVYVLENSKIYILQGGRSNEYWKELGTGSGTGGTTFVGQFPTADLLPTSGRSAGDYAFVGTGDDFVQYNWDNIANEWVMAEGQTDMASEFFHIGYKTPLRRPVIFPLFPKDVLVQESGDFVFVPETSVARFIFVGEVTAIRGIETAAADREIKLVNRTGSDIPLRDKASGIPSGSGMDFGGSDYTWVNGSEITLKGNGTYWQLAPNNQVAFSDHLDSVNAQVSVGSDGLEVITGVNDNFTGEIISFKEIGYTPETVDGSMFVGLLGKFFKREYTGFINIRWFGVIPNDESKNTINTTLIQLCLNVAPKYSDILIPEGTFYISNALIPREGQRIHFEGELKLKDNGTPVIRMIALNNRNVELINPRLDMDRENNTEDGDPGTQTIISNYGNGFNCKIYGGVLKNGMDNFFQGGRDNFLMDGTLLDGVGEHAFYFNGATGGESGGNASRISLLNIAIKNIAQDTTRAEGHAFQIRNCNNIYVNNINFDAGDPVIPSFYFLLTNVKGLTANELRGRGFGHRIIYADADCNNLTFDGFDVDKTGVTNNISASSFEILTDSVKVTNSKFTDCIVTGNIPAYIEKCEFIANKGEISSSRPLTQIKNTSIEVNSTRYAQFTRTVELEDVTWLGNATTLGVYITPTDSTSRSKIIRNKFKTAISNPIYIDKGIGHIVEKNDLEAITASNKIVIKSTTLGSVVVKGNKMADAATSVSDETGRAIIEDNIGFIKADKTSSTTDYVFVEEDQFKYLRLTGTGTATLNTGTFTRTKEIRGEVDGSGTRTITAGSGFTLRGNAIVPSNSRFVIRFKSATDAIVSVYSNPSPATQSQVNTGTNTSTFVTPETLAGSTRIVGSVGATLLTTDGVNLSGTYVNGAITFTNINGGGVGAGFPSNYGHCRTFNGQSSSFCWSIYKNVVGPGIWVQYYNSSGVGQGWQRIDATNASTTQRGIIEQATDAEAITGTDTERAVSPANLQAKLNSLILSATATLDFPTIAAGETERLTATVTGAALLDPVLVSGPADIYNANNSTIDAWVSAANTVTVRVRNNGASSIDPGEGQFKIKVFK